MAADYVQIRIPLHAGNSFNRRLYVVFVSLIGTRATRDSWWNLLASASCWERFSADVAAGKDD
jgi:hypothetical protein